MQENNFPQYLTKNLFTATITLIPTVIIFYAGIAVIFVSAKKIRRKYTLYHEHPRETGLYHLAQEMLEHLEYQTTITTSQDANLGVWKFSAKIFKSKQLATRPVSLPGLTAECVSFLGKVSEVFGGKSIICFDELDKITDPEQLEELLKGIKGLLGQQRSYFILTVSEDAIARFSTRRRSQRDMLESSFEEIFYLDRINITTAQKLSNLW